MLIRGPLSEELRTSRRKRRRAGWDWGRAGALLMPAAGTRQRRCLGPGPAPKAFVVEVRVADTERPLAPSESASRTQVCPIIPGLRSFS